MDNKLIMVDLTEIVVKAESYCVYQERSIHEVRQKLQQWDLPQQEVEGVITHLIQEDFLNEVRFAEAYTLGKFRINGWGKTKIKQALKLKRIAPELITESLNKIDNLDYINKLQQLIEKKSKLLTEEDQRKRRHKLIQYALTKGFEQELIFDILSHPEKCLHF
ncbi:MAG: regulatory protein RecX [Sphingobacteriaceae bacterium]|jgi:regulatory protein|nr:MAG: RecX family transcriptional regulator [Pedobacter sp.]